VRRADALARIHDELAVTVTGAERGIESGETTRIRKPSAAGIQMRSEDADAGGALDQLHRGRIARVHFEDDGTLAVQYKVHSVHADEPELLGEGLGEATDLVERCARRLQREQVAAISEARVRGEQLAPAEQDALPSVAYEDGRGRNAGNVFLQDLRT